MNELIEFLTSKEIIVVYIVAAVAVLLGFIIYLIDKNYYKRKQRHNTKELNKLVEQVNEIVEKEGYEEVEEEIYDTPVLSPNVEEVTEPAFVPLTIEEQRSLDEELLSKNEIVVDNLEELNNLNVEDIVLEAMPQEEILPIEQVEETTIIEPEIIEEQEELQYTSIEPNRQQAQEELMRLTQELEKAEEEARAIDLTSYEEEQEENAVISIEELLTKNKAMYENDEFAKYEDEGNEPISLEELEMRMNKVQKDIVAIEEELEIIEPKQEITAVEEVEVIEELEPTPQKVVLDDFNTIKIEEEVLEPVVETKPLYQSYQTEKKFERSPVISPIYGIERRETSEDIALENTANYEKLDEEIKKTNEFLMTLRELQGKLD